jgi:dipeptide transport system ATP-binding protein
MTAALSVQGLHVAIGKGTSSANVLRGVSLEVEPGEVRGLVGESGAGKSMLGRAVLGLLPDRARVSGGTIRFEGRDLLAMPERERRGLLGRRIALIPQDPMTSLNPVKRVGAQIAAVLRHHLNLSRREALERGAELLAEVAIRDPRRVLGLYPHEISGGMRQRVLIAMAFACDPSLVIADEPTTALDVTVQRQVLQLVERLRLRQDVGGGAAILFVTHDLGVVAKICRSMTVLHAGRVLEEGATADILARPRHPYTRALLAATPRADRPADALRPVPPALIAELWAEAHRLDRLTVVRPAMAGAS